MKSIEIPKIISGVYIMANSDLSAISLANYFNANSILLSGIKLSNMYEKFLEGKDLVFQIILKNNSKIFSLNGILAEQITFDDWKIS